MYNCLYSYAGDYLICLDTCIAYWSLCEHSLGSMIWVDILSTRNQKPSTWWETSEAWLWSKESSTCHSVSYRFPYCYGCCIYTYKHALRYCLHIDINDNNTICAAFGLKYCRSIVDSDSKSIDTCVQELVYACNRQTYK